MCGGENWLLIVLVLSVKKVAKSSAVIEVVGGGAFLFYISYTHTHSSWLSIEIR